MKKTCLAVLALGLFSQFANATAYSDQVGRLQSQYDLALKGDKNAAAFVCREGNLPQLKVRFIERNK